MRRDIFSHFSSIGFCEAFTDTGGKISVRIWLWLEGRKKEIEENEEQNNYN